MCEVRQKTDRASEVRPTAPHGSLSAVFYILLTFRTSFVNGTISANELSSVTSYTIMNP